MADNNNQLPIKFFNESGHVELVQDGSTRGMDTTGWLEIARKIGELKRDHIRNQMRIAHPNYPRSLGAHVKRA